MNDEIKDYLNELHVPEDAGEYEEDIEDILLRIPEGWGRWLTCDKGWYPLVIETHKKLNYIDPNYEVHQIKEKFGSLRYYYHSSWNYYSIPGKIMQDIVNGAEKESTRTCENCGAGSAKIRDKNRWLKCLCKKCAITLGYSIKEDDV